MGVLYGILLRNGLPADGVRGVRAEIRIWACAADVLYEAVELVTGGELVFFASSDASACALRLGVGLVVSLCGES